MDSRFRPGNIRRFINQTLSSYKSVLEFKDFAYQQLDDILDDDNPKCHDFDLVFLKEMRYYFNQTATFVDALGPGKGDYDNIAEELEDVETLIMVIKTLFVSRNIPSADSLKLLDIFEYLIKKRDYLQDGMESMASSIEP